MSSEVRFAAMIPARRAVCRGSPFFRFPARICRIVAGAIVTRPVAIASRAVTAFAPTSTIRTCPRSSTCESLGTSSPEPRVPSPELRAERGILLLGIGLPLGKEERQALERHCQIHALHLHVGRHLERSG